MLYYLTLFATIVFYHLVLGFFLYVVLSAIIKLTKVNTELQSWLWITAFVTATLLPFSSIVTEPATTILLSQNNSTLRKDIPLTEEIGVFRPIKESVADKISFISDVNGADASFEWNVSSGLVSSVSKWFFIFFLIWIIGSLWRVVCITKSIIFTRKLISSTRLISDASYYTEYCVSEVRTSKEIRSPMVIGIFRPVIVVPVILVETFDRDSLVPILLHEEAHIRRKDLWVGAFQELLALVFWWSPIIRLMNWKLHCARELACDTRATRELSNGKRYAQSLIDCAQFMLVEQSNVLSIGLFAKKKELVNRVNEALKISNFSVPNIYTIIFSCICLFLTSISIAKVYVPKINLDNIETQSNHYSLLSRKEGDLLHSIISSGDYKALEAMIGKGLNINTPIYGKGTPLIMAIRNGDNSMAKALIELGADVNQSAKGDGNPLIAAAEANSIEMITVLYKEGANLDAVVHRYGSPLIVSVRRQNNEAAQYLINLGASVNKHSPWDGNPLIAASISGNYKMARELYLNGAEVNSVTPFSETPLINAASQGDFEMVKFLVDNGADVNLSVDVSSYSTRGNISKYRSPLNSVNNHPRIRDFLIEKGAKVL